MIFSSISELLHRTTLKVSQIISLWFKHISHKDTLCSLKTSKENSALLLVIIANIKICIQILIKICLQFLSKFVFKLLTPVQEEDHYKVWQLCGECSSACQLVSFTTMPICLLESLKMRTRPTVKSKRAQK